MDPHRPEPEEHWHNRQFDEYNRQEMENMTSHDKAWVILCQINGMFVSKEDWSKASEYAKSELKRKCLFVISEIIDSNPLSPTKSPVGSIEENKLSSLKYWEEVKGFIERL